MKKDKKQKAVSMDTPADVSLKKDMPIKNTITDRIKNSASQTTGLNQANTSRDDLFPSDGDNLTK